MATASGMPSFHERMAAGTVRVDVNETRRQQAVFEILSHDIRRQLPDWDYGFDPSVLDQDCLIADD
ncbi:hypothetical protein E3O45_07850 [Cryobacterium sp. TMS1-20-1]|uniref:hypothetical protein n=1 Tax=Cryobacterium sp. TMS1-20-1 TaxID=1259223 RepID=UPI00106C4D52|nr:hypothetical protein [Cryobacterium sp. TMS1-20-1]TFC77263.1 hypothetical protein E3O45_07850 [Cryobacterium sp. TMS1-20-1]